MQTIVELTREYSAHGITFNKIALREPTYSEVHMQGIGRPFEYQPSKQGVVAVTYPTVVDEYVQKLIVEPGYECITGICAADALRLERAVCNFFTEQTTSSKPPTSSSSGSDFQQTLSSE